MTNNNIEFQNIESVEDMINIANDIVSQYCTNKNINENDIYPSIWSDILDELYITLIHPNIRLLKTDNNRYNQYDKDKVNYIYKYIYRRLCNSHCQEVCLKGFLDMTGIDKQTIYNWSKESSSKSFDLHEKIMEDNEESLFNLMKDRRNNPMKLLPKLNKVHGWNMPGVGKSKEEKTQTTIDDIAKQLESIQSAGLLADANKSP